MTFVLNRDFLTEVERGNVEGYSLVHKYGRNPAVGNGSEDGILQAAANFTFRTSATTFRIAAGGNAADTSAGAGAREITIQGITDALEEAS